MMKGKLSLSGYRNNSKDVNNDFNIIPSNRISMRGVSFPVHGVDDTGHEITMMPGSGEHIFPGNYVIETPIRNDFKQIGGGIDDKKIGDEVFYNPAQNLKYSKIPSKENMPVMNKEIFDAQKREQALRLKKDYQAISKSGLSPEEYYKKYPSESEWIRKNFNPHELPDMKKHGGTTGLSPEKAKEMLKDGTVYGHPLSDSQRAYFASVAGTDGDGNDLEGEGDNDYMQLGGAKKMSVSEWDNYHAGLGHSPIPYTVTGAAPSKYKQYYNPQAYQGVNLTGKGFDTSIKDSDIFQYKEPINTFQPTVVTPTSTRNVQITPTGKIITDADGTVHYFDSQNNPINPITESYGSKPGLKFGGTADDMKVFMRNYFNKKMGGDIKFQQGQNMDSYLDDRMETFKKFLVKNTINHMINNEVDGIHNNGFMQLGGFKGENEGDVQVPLSPEEQAYRDWQSQQQRMAAGDNTPWAGPSPNAQNSALNSTAPINFNGTNSFNNFSKKHGQSMADTAIAGTNFLASIFEQKDRKAAEAKLKQKMSTDYMFAPVDSTMNKGNYDTNSGAFRPNNFTPQLKEGGVVYMDLGQIDAFLKHGGTVKYLD